MAIFTGILCGVGCTSKRNPATEKIFIVATCADYPPFEYYTQEKDLEGFDIELIQLVAKNLKKHVTFEVLEFGAIFAALETNRADVGISTIAITPERRKKIEFSAPYYTQRLYAIFRKEDFKQSQEEIFRSFSGKVFGCQMGTTMEHWIKLHYPQEQCLTMDENLPLIEALKSKKVDIVILDGYQAKTLCRITPQLGCCPVGKSNSSYAIALPKNSLLLAPINAALKALEKSGELDALKRKYHLD
ncbi:substrate-binding periplasmic protein [Holospora undulata]|nr:ABC transporter substrate-binding protein [Holospora undulata]